MPDLSIPPDDEQKLQAEIERLNKIIKALIDRAEQDMNATSSDFNVFSSTVMLEDKVRIRTHELEEALLKNAKITRALQQAKIIIEQSEQHLRDITSALGEGLLVVDREGTIQFINAAACRMLGLSENDALHRGAHELFHHSHPDGTPYPRELCMNAQVLKTREPYFSEDEYYWRKDGTGFFASVISTPIKFKEKTRGVVIAFHDITQSIEERNRLRELQSAIDQSPVSVLIVNKDKNIIYANPELLQSMEHTKEQVQFKKMTIFQWEEKERKLEELWKALLSGKPWSGELFYRRKDGEEFWQSWKFAPVIREQGKTQNFVGVGENITEKKKLHALLEEMSYQDGLTHIANRRRFDEYFSMEWESAQREAKSLAIIMVDIDFFKRYNDNLGHQAGDKCLIKIARALKNNLHRAVDLVARYGGEEFVCILPGAHLEGAKLLAEILRQAICDLEIPHPDSEISPYVTVSMGIASCIPHQGKQNNLLKDADTALYQAKKLGRNRCEAANSNRVC